MSRRSLQEVERVLERVVRLGVQAVGGQEGELVRVLAHGGHAHVARAVEVHVRQLVRQALDLQ